MTLQTTSLADYTADIQARRRTAYIRNRRVLADILEAHPEIPLPAYDDGATVTFHFLGDDDPRAAMAATARAFRIPWRKQPREYDDGTAYFDLLGDLGTLKLKLTAFRDAVCERVVTGTEDREVEEVVQPAVTRMVTHPVEIVEWKCGSLLAPEGPGDAA